jgi:glycosyltransferase involved in cell wall biosynthesis
VSIIVLTFYRPQKLEEALRSCLGQRTHSGAPFEIVVVDNAPDASAAPIVARLATGAITLRYVHEPRPGTSRARNAGFMHARGRFFALIDDDEQASPEWLTHLTRAQRDYDADVVFGPVYPKFDRPPKRHLEFLTRFYTYALERPTGSVVGERATNNALVRRGCWRTAEPFNIALGLTAGEDTLFFSQLRAEGARFVWCAEAFVTERIPRERTSWRYVCRLSFQRGQCRAATPLLLDPPRVSRTIFWMGVGAVQFLGLLPAVSVLWLIDRQRALYCAWKMLAGLGKLLFWTGRHQIYGKPPVSAAP